MSNIKDFKLNIEKSPFKRSYKKTRSVTILSLNTQTSNDDLHKNNKAIKYNSLSKKKVYSKQSTVSNLKNSLELKSTSESSVLLFPKKILKYKSISTTKVHKRLNKQGVIKKSKNVQFKTELEEVKLVESVKEKLINSGVYDKKYNNFDDDKVKDKAACSCSCIIF